MRERNNKRLQATLTDATWQKLEEMETEMNLKKSALVTLAINAMYEKERKELLKETSEK